MRPEWLCVHDLDPVTRVRRELHAVELVDGSRGHLWGRIVDVTESLENQGSRSMNHSLVAALKASEGHVNHPIAK